MGTTPTYGLPYSEVTDRPEGDEQIQALAEKIEAALKTIEPDSGMQTDAPVSAGADWGILVAEYRLIGKDCTLHVWVERIGSNIAVSSSGNIVGDPTIATIDDPALWPTMQVAGWFRHSRTGGAVQLDTTGIITILDAHSSSAIETNSDEQSSTVQMSFNYPIP